MSRCDIVNRPTWMNHLSWILPRCCWDLQIGAKFKESWKSWVHGWRKNVREFNDFQDTTSDLKYARQRNYPLNVSIKGSPPKDRLEPMLYIFPVNCLLDQQVCFSGGQKQTKQNINGDICLKAKICKKNRIGNAPSHPFRLFPDIHPFWQEWASLN